MTPIDVLKKARDLLIARGWVQGYYARLADDRTCSVTDPKAAGFCAQGAIFAVPGVPAHVAESATTLLEKACPRCPATRARIPHFNDARKRTKEEVVAVFDKAILRGELS